AGYEMPTTRRWCFLRAPASTTGPWTSWPFLIALSRVADDEEWAPDARATRPGRQLGYGSGGRASTTSRLGEAPTIPAGSGKIVMPGDLFEALQQGGLRGPPRPLAGRPRPLARGGRHLGPHPPVTKLAEAAPTTTGGISAIIGGPWLAATSGSPSPCSSPTWR